MFCITFGVTYVLTENVLFLTITQLKYLTPYSD